MSNNMSTMTYDSDKTFQCDECDKSFTTKQGKSLHITLMHKKGKEETMKRQRSETEDKEKYKCKNCHYECKSEYALKTHMSHAHKEAPSPENKKQKIDDIENVGSDNQIEMKTIEPSQEFLAHTAKTLAEMLDAVQDDIDKDEDDTDTDQEDEEIEQEELTKRLLALKGPERTKLDDEEMYVTLLVTEVADLKQNLRDAEFKADEFKVKFDNQRLK